MPYSSAGQPYATRTDLYTVIAAAALTHPSTGTAAQDAELLRASELLDGYLRQQFILPLVRWGSDVVRMVCDVAAYRLVCLRGFNPELQGDSLYRDNFQAAELWMRDVAKGLVSPDVVDSSPTAEPGKQADARAPGAVSPAPMSVSGNRTRGSSYR